MKTTLFYFTGTGNSLFIARELAKRNGETEIIPIPRMTTKDELKEGLNMVEERIGIVFPTYGGGMPLPVFDWVRQVQLKPGQYFFAVATYGSLPGNVLGQAGRLLKERKLKLSAGFKIRMPGNLTFISGALSPEEQRKLFFKAVQKLDRAAETIKKNKMFIERTGILAKLYSRSMKAQKRRPFHENFKTDSRCNGCGTCVKICRSYNITMKDGKPVWHDLCGCCFACLQWCPMESIQFGESTIGRKRYHHPEIVLNDITLSGTEAL